MKRQRNNGHPAEKPVLSHAPGSFSASSGLTLLEVLVALSVVGISFLALALTQVSNLKATVRSQAITELKAEANGVLEVRMAEVLDAVDVGSPTHSYFDVEDVYTDSSGNQQTRFLSFLFIDYYYSCPTVSSAPRSIRSVDCSGEETGEDGVTVRWSLSGRSGVPGEGLLDIVVTASHDEGSGFTIGDVISCYEVYPSPSSEVPAPCPEPTLSGGGR